MKKHVGDHLPALSRAGSSVQAAASFFISYIHLLKKVQFEAINCIIFEHIRYINRI